MVPCPTTSQDSLDLNSREYSGQSFVTDTSDKSSPILPPRHERHRDKAFVCRVSDQSQTAAFQMLPFEASFFGCSLCAANIGALMILIGFR